MRVLLIDNHDSFTYNLAHDIAVVTGVWPDVVLNDAPLETDARAWLDGYDAVVVSPGPGTPEDAVDLGHSRSAVEQSEVPVLGVCLGHQAIGHAYGARVQRAPRPVHGEVAHVEHNGTGLFAGLPDPLRMVRYHSLVVTGLPPHLVADAWCDELVMALHHRSRPLWGVQTHPESISSAHGRIVLGNFLELAREWNDTRRVRMDGTVRDESWPGAALFASVGAAAGARSAWSAPSARSGGAQRTVIAECVEYTGSTEALFDTLFRGRDHAWWLDSAMRGEDAGRFSYLGSAAGPLARVATSRCDGAGVWVRDADGEQTCAGTMLDLVERDLASAQVAVVVEGQITGQITGQDEGAGVGAPPFDFHLGWVGYLGYEAGTRALIGEPPADETSGSEADAVLVFADRAVVVDHRDGAAWALALLPPEEPVCSDPTGVATRQREWLREAVATLSRAAGTTSDTGTAYIPPPGEFAEISLRHGHAEYLELVRRCIELITAGESYELCLTNRITVRAITDSWSLYRRLRSTSPRPFAAYLAFDGVHVLSASPERFMRVSGGQVEAKPIKGTRPRGATPEEDARLAAELASDPKELAENLMIVDLLRNDLGRVCRTGSVHVPVLFDVETYDGVHQLVSTVRGELGRGLTSVDAVRVAFPGGSMTGAPKERSVWILRELEDGPRGVYSGAIGYFSLSGAADWSIVIRSILWQPDHLTYGVGGAVTARSDPEAEWRETVVKARTLGSALGVDLDEVLAPAPRDSV